MNDQDSRNSDKKSKVKKVTKHVNTGFIKSIKDRRPKRKN